MSEPVTVEKVPPRRGGVEWRNLSWIVIIAIAFAHAAALLAVFPQLFSWSGLAIAVFLSWITGGVGITLCFHRLLTHRSFRTPKWFEYILATCGCLAWQGSPVDWVGMHRLHHKHSDGDGDPHSPKHGFTWSHILWTLHDKLEGLEAREAAKDLLRDRGMRIIDRFFWLPQIIMAAALFLAGWAIGDIWLGASWVVWGVAVRTVFVFHGTWFVNSATHTWGYKNYKQTGEGSTNLWWVALLSYGEGWHNNHHAHPRSAAHGLRWFEFDLTWFCIRALSMVGLAKDIYRLEPEDLPVKSRRAKRAIARKLALEAVASPREQAAV